MALVTGASAGIGWTTCTALARAGLRVVAVARRRERLEALQQAVVAGGVPISEFLPVVCDITKVSSLCKPMSTGKANSEGCWAIYVLPLCIS